MGKEESSRKKTEDWLKPGRVVSSESVWEDESIFSFRRYLRKDERPAYIRGNGFFCTFKYDDEGKLVCEKMVCDAEDKEPAGILFGDTIKTGS